MLVELGGDENGPSRCSVSSDDLQRQAAQLIRTRRHLREAKAFHDQDGL